MQGLVKFIQNLALYGLEFFGRYYSVYRGIVATNADPDNRARIKIRVPAIFGDEKVLAGWANPISQFAGKGHGGFHPPEKDEMVYVMFEQGDLSYPMYIGGWWAKGELPIEFQMDGEKKVRGFKTKGGHKLLYNDDETSDEYGITVETNAGNFIKLFDKKKEVEIKTTAGLDVLMQDDGKRIKIDSTDHQVVVTPSGIQIGSEGSSQPLILGYQWQALFASHTHMTPDRMSSPPVQAGQAGQCLSSDHKTEK